MTSWAAARVRLVWSVSVWGFELVLELETKLELLAELLLKLFKISVFTGFV